MEDPLGQQLFVKTKDGQLVQVAHRPNAQDDTKVARRAFTLSLVPAIISFGLMLYYFAIQFPIYHSRFGTDWNWHELAAGIRFLVAFSIICQSLVVASVVSTATLIALTIYHTSHHINHRAAWQALKNADRK